MKNQKKKEQGFTIIELVTVMGTIGVLASLSMSSFYLYRKDAYYSVAESTMRNARSSMEIGINSSDVEAETVPLVSQTSAGNINNVQANKVLPGMKLPQNVEFKVSYDPDCQDSSCDAQFLSVNHCIGKLETSWIRFGDGLDLSLENIATGGCS